MLLVGTKGHNKSTSIIKICFYRSPSNLAIRIHLFLMGDLQLLLSLTYFHYYGRMHAQIWGVYKLVDGNSLQTSMC